MGKSSNGRVRNRVSLILNADDFGYTPEVNRGIAECVTAGVVTSASLLPNLPGFADACLRLKSGVPLSLGIHLNFTSGSPLLPPTELKPLLNNQGVFPGPASMACRLIRRVDLLAFVEREARAQIEHILVAQPAPIWHLDVHHHLQVVPHLLELLIRLAKEYRIPALRTPKERVLWGADGASVPWKALLLSCLGRRGQARITAAGLKTPDALYATVLTSSRDFVRTLRDVVGRLRPGVSEIALHPGYSSSHLARMDSYHHQRQDELQVLLGEEGREILRAPGLRLISYRDLAELPFEVMPSEGDAR